LPDYLLLRVLILLRSWPSTILILDFWVECFADLSISCNFLMMSHWILRFLVRLSGVEEMFLILARVSIVV
jgi:hypothetical protein